MVKSAKVSVMNKKPIPFQRAVNALGSQSALARLLGVSNSTLHHWHKRGRLPAEHAVLLEKKTKGQIPRWQTRPDLWTRKMCEAGK